MLFRSIERCKALSIDELLKGNGDTIAANADAGIVTPLTINDSTTGVYDARASKLSNNHYSYDLTMATYTGTSVNKDSDGLACYKGSNNINYYVQTILSPNKGDIAGTGAGSAWKVNNYSMPAFAEVRDTKNYVLMEEIYRYDTSIKTIDRKSVV